ncbi:MAG: PhzF family phenazine biosynthesis protein [Desulfovibrionaceae bacterium]
MTASTLSGLAYRQVDVFADQVLGGNGLTVFFDADRLDAALMQALTCEMRQFESIFLFAGSTPNAVRAHIFTMEEELDFAGHPVLGAAAALHDRLDGYGERDWILELNAKEVPVRTRRVRHGQGAYEASMDQGIAELGPMLQPDVADRFLAAMGLTHADLEPGLLPQVVSTGLPYLILPVAQGLERARVAHPTLEPLLAEIGAKFAYVLDVPALEGRTWDNAGLVEDIATGSAAGPVGAFLVAHGRARSGQEIVLSQGRFTGRRATLRVEAAQEDQDLRVRVSGQVHMAASGVFD